MAPTVANVVRVSAVDGTEDKAGSPLLGEAIQPKYDIICIEVRVAHHFDLVRSWYSYSKG